MAEKEGQPVTRKRLHEYAMKLKNWDKWGPDDELGALNYIAPEAIIEAARVIKKGKVFLGFWIWCEGGHYQHEMLSIRSFPTQRASAQGEKPP